jgi:F-type H+-transporting ATPase subunit delta
VAAVARRYAAAYFDLAQEAGELEQWGAELKRAQQTLSDPRLGVAMANPRVRIPDRVDLAMKLLDDVSVPARNLVRLLISRGRLGSLNDVVAEYDTMVEAASGVLRAVVTSAVPLTPAVEQRVATVLTERFHQPVRVENRQDPALIGGLVVRVGDRVIDDSVRTHLQQLQAALA